MDGNQNGMPYTSPDMKGKAYIDGEPEYLKPNWMAIRMAVKRGERTKAELRKCGCSECQKALDFMEAENE